MSPAPTSTGSFVTAVFNGVPANLCLISWSDPPLEITEKKKYTSPAQTITTKTASGPHPCFGRNESIRIDSYPDYAVNATLCFTTNPKSRELRNAWVVRLGLVQALASASSLHNPDRDGRRGAGRERYTRKDSPVADLAEQ